MDVREVSAPTAPHQLITIAEQLRQGHALLSKEQFIEGLRSGDLEIWELPRKQYALIAIGISQHGLAANILTTVGRMEDAVVGLEAIESLARERGCRCVISVGQLGWTKLAEAQGYTVTRTILMKKVFNAN